jgi:hypothetical protein
MTRLRRRKGPASPPRGLFRRYAQARLITLRRNNSRSDETVFRAPGAKILLCAGQEFSSSPLVIPAALAFVLILRHPHRSKQKPPGDTDIHLPFRRTRLSMMPLFFQQRFCILPAPSG